MFLFEGKLRMWDSMCVKIVEILMDRMKNLSRVSSEGKEKEKVGYFTKEFVARII